MQDESSSVTGMIAEEDIESGSIDYNSERQSLLKSEGRKGGRDMSRSRKRISQLNGIQFQPLAESWLYAGCLVHDEAIP
eukprot:403861-Hanusia_phi.AAC.13